jgi:hypothetical protein
LQDIDELCVVEVSMWGSEGCAVVAVAGDLHARATARVHPCMCAGHTHRLPWPLLPHRAPQHPSAMAAAHHSSCQATAQRPCRAMASCRQHHPCSR